jgi:prophage regulatory protein
MAEQVHRVPTVLRRRQVEAHTGLSRSTIYARVREGSFPAPISLGAKAVGWLQSDIEDWIAERVRSRRNITEPTP